MVLISSRGDYLIGEQLPLATKVGRQIRNERRSERVPAALEAARRMVLTHHPTARLRSLTATYNCMGMVFANRRTTVSTDDLSMILADDEYRSVSSQADLVPGDLAVYKNATGAVVHVGLIAEIAVSLRQAERVIMVVSQWGADGEYFHRADDVNPALGAPVEYWTDRRE